MLAIQLGLQRWFPRFPASLATVVAGISASAAFGLNALGIELVGEVHGVLALVYHASRRPVFVLGRKPGTDVFRPRTPEHPEDESFPGLLLLKTDRLSGAVRNHKRPWQT
jgi:MFS superfamily sulfate permease-like transporter